MDEEQLRDLRRRAARAENDARHFQAKRGAAHLAPRTHGPLQWTLEHAAIVDDGATYHRSCCPEVNGRSGRWYPAGQPLPQDEVLHACSVCGPRLALIGGFMPARAS